MSDAAQDMLQEARSLLEQAAGPEQVEEVRVRYLGRKGLVAGLLAEVPKLPPEERPAAGRAANQTKQAIARLVEEAAERLAAATRPSGPRPDPTLPPIRPPRGHVHPVSRTMEEMLDIFRTLGFESVLGSEVETDWYNFEALNIPADHPARDDWDTYYISDKVLLRPHMSPAQIRVMEVRQPPLRIVVPGRCYRRDTEDARHFSMFHQLEGLMVGEGVNFGDLKAVLHIFLQRFFRAEMNVRFEPDFFPFTEPSAQVHCTCVACRAGRSGRSQGCQTCSYTGWLEILGCGMVDPNVFEAVGYDAERYTGFAFGMGIDRLAMLKHEIPDGRLLFQGDLRFLRQF